ncbi:PXA domain-containing protein [Lasiosphaeria hispida]|uniref:PXA domain-containing protein n=1 Tax=Lasiosphaeria hispida TaxID=260671 RepID=A0AAJ0MIE3_9PEZI|nr:PXA domain-containing protein [Lasiosphaeria hispida]
MVQEDAHDPRSVLEKMEETSKTQSDTADLIVESPYSEDKAIDRPNVASTTEPVELNNEAEDWTTKLFQFLATATPETLGGVGVGLAAITYFILGQLGLLLIGAFVGIVLFVQWQQRNADVARIVKGERGIDILARLLDARKGDGEGLTDEQADVLARRFGFGEFQPETQEALNELVEAVVTDYVKWWYSPIVPSDKFFPLAARKSLVSFITSISNHLCKKRPADSFLDFLTNSTSIVIVFFSELSSAFEGVPSGSDVLVADVITNYLASQPESNLANLINQRQQAGKFRMVAEDLLGFVDRSTYECDPARVFLREILAGIILETTLQKCSKPEWINSWIVYLLEAGEPDFSHAIDVGMQTGPGAEVAFADLDGNVGNIGLTKGNKNSFDQERARRKEPKVHKKMLSKAEEEIDAMEEVRRLNQMIAEEDARRSQTSLDIPESVPPRSHGQAPGEARSSTEASERLASAFKRNADALDIQTDSIDTQRSTHSDGSSSSKNEPIHTPLTPLSAQGSSSQSASPPYNSSGHFTSFDQIVPPVLDEAEIDEEEARKPPPLTLHRATITILDEPGDRGRIRTKPNWDYLVQIEPATTVYPGWMIVRKYSDFERLHEVLRRIATISGVTVFTEQHNMLPSWKTHTRTTLRGDLERYLQDACWFQSLADSEGMKRFLERDQNQIPSSSKLGFQAFEKLGKNVFDVVTSAPMEGSKAVVGGITGVLGTMGLGQRKSTVVTPTPAPPQPSSLQDVTAASRLSMSTLPRPDSSASFNGSRKTRDSLDSQRSSVVATQPGKMPLMERRPSYNSQFDQETESLRPSRRSGQNSREHSREHSRASSLAPARSPSALSFEGMRLPPPPDSITDDYVSPISPTNGYGRPQEYHQSHTRSLTMPSLGGQRAGTPPQQPQQPAPPAVQPQQRTPPEQQPLAQKPAKKYPTLSEPETRVAVELLFAVINELYTLSSAWNIRRTLLAAAKSFLLRPGNPSLLSIQSLIQTSVLDANTSDTGLAAHLRKLRENALPTEQELAAWPAEMSDEEKEKLRIKARKLLIESGVPAALMGVMGQAATAEALGRLFDCLQVEEVARGLVFGVMLQAVRGVTH